ncbi:MAG: STAS domain-containing protein [Lachnospiraceae bacterium]|nr:STAS domain-containing protein [Lachnospiraceae bacterium]
MTINKEANGSDLKITLSGRLDTTTAPELESELKDSLDGVTSLTFDFKELAYISSAGLRVLLSAQKIMNKAAGEMKIVGSNDEIKEIFEVTGFNDILNIE